MNKLLKSVPQNPGVYQFKNEKGHVLYVGKAINLKKRLSSYYQKTPSEKVRLLVDQSKKIDFIIVDSEIEALLLEANLIKKFQPYFNYQLKDDKDYLYIKITEEDFPRVLTVRKKDLVGAKTYFGPFTSATVARSTLRLARKIFPFRLNCKPLSGKACLGFHLSLCPGVCVGAVSKKEYAKIIRQLVVFLSGNTREVVGSLEKQMQTYAAKKEFEKAEKVRKAIEGIKFTTKRIEDVERYLEGPEILENKYRLQVEELSKALKIKKFLERIECYDISHVSGTNAVGSMVVLINGQFNKDDYRRFRIKTVQGINDPAQMAEVLTRRFNNDWPRPNLVIVDGGKTQLGAALGVFNKLRLTIPVVGLAKRNEELYLPGQKETLRLPKDSPALYLITRTRDEAHRFAITYHRKLRSKFFLTEI